MCELTPCWLLEETSQCAVHGGIAIACPMLLFCLQVMDEFIASNTQRRQETWRVALCTLARCVFVARWDAYVLSGCSSSSQEIALHDFLARKTGLAGVAYEVWRIVGAYWDKYKQSYVHHQELHFVDTCAFERMTPQRSVWSATRDLLHIYGMRASQAARLTASSATVDLSAAGSSAAAVAQSDVLTSKQLTELVASSPVDAPLRFGVAYLRQVQDTSSAAVSSERVHRPMTQRPVISQAEWKVAFKAIVIHVQKWNADAQVFPCGAFSRGAAFGSTIDLLVASPQAPSSVSRKPSSSPSTRRTSQRYDDVVRALASAKVVQKAAEHRVGPTRSLFAVPYKRVLLVLDLKVFEPPQSWFALVYFTGPQSFTRAFFAALLQMPLRELSELSFDAVFAHAIDMLGWETLAAVASEKDVFELAGREYVLPSSRM